MTSMVEICNVDKQYQNETILKFYVVIEMKRWTLNEQNLTATVM